MRGTTATMAAVSEADTMVSWKLRRSKRQRGMKRLNLKPVELKAVEAG